MDVLNYTPSLWLGAKSHAGMIEPGTCLAAVKNANHF